MLSIETTDSLPPVRRGGGRTSEERKQIQDALKTGDVQVVKGIESGNRYNALQQLIRQAAHSMDLKVKIVFRRHEDNPEIGDVYFHGYKAEDADKVAASAIRQTKNKATA